jgi:hypothetical protein
MLGRHKSIPLFPFIELVGEARIGLTAEQLLLQLLSKGLP